MYFVDVLHILVYYFQQQNLYHLKHTCIYYIYWYNIHYVYIYILLQIMKLRSYYAKYRGICYFIILLLLEATIKKYFLKNFLMKFNVYVVKLQLQQRVSSKLS